jgi:hypothetical protein
LPSTSTSTPAYIDTAIVASCVSSSFTSQPPIHRVKKKKNPATPPLMRFVPTLSRFIFSLSSFARVRSPLRTRQPALQPLRLQSMSGIPFLSALFGSASKPSSNMTYPDQRTEDEWRAILNPSKLPQLQCCSS